MTITSSTETQLNPAVRKQAQNADAKASPKNDAETKPSATDTPAVVVETTAQVSAAEEKLAATAPTLTSVDDALNAAKSIGAALAEQENAIANASSGQVAGLLSEFEAAVA